MKIYRLVFLMILMVIITYSQAKAAKIVVEAENYTSIKSSMSLKADNKCSLKKCVQIPLKRPHGVNETGPIDIGYVSYEIKISEPGNYQFWGRCKWYDTSGNSFYILVDADTVGSKTPYITDQTFGKWHWVAGPRVNLSQGSHTIRIQNREDGSEIDQWLLTTILKGTWQPIRVERETAH